MNKVFLIGNITKDPEMKQIEDGILIANTSIATNEFYKNKQGEKQQQTEFHNLTAFWKTAELFEKYVRKGQKIFIEGKIKTKSWEGKDNKKHYSTYILVDKIEFLWGNKKEEELTENDVTEVFNKPSKKYNNEVNIEDIPF